MRMYILRTYNLDDKAKYHLAGVYMALFLSLFLYICFNFIKILEASGGLYKRVEPVSRYPLPIRNSHKPNKNCKEKFRLNDRYLHDGEWVIHPESMVGQKNTYTWPIYSRKYKNTTKPILSWSTFNKNTSINFKTCLTSKQLKISLFGDSRMRQLLFSLDSFYKNNFTKILDMGSHSSYTSPVSKIKFNWVTLLNDFNNFRKNKLDFNFKDVIIIGPMLLHQVATLDLAKHVERSGSNKQKLTRDESEIKTNKTLEELIRNWESTLVDLEISYPEITFIILMSEYSMKSALNDYRCYYCRYWTDQLNAILNKFYQSRINQKEKTYDSNVHIFSSNIRMVNHPVNKELILGDRHHLMKRKHYTDLPGSLWAQGLALVNFICNIDCS